MQVQGRQRRHAPQIASRWGAERAAPHGGRARSARAVGWRVAPRFGARRAAATAAAPESAAGAGRAGPMVARECAVDQVQGPLCGARRGWAERLVLGAGKADLPVHAATAITALQLSVPHTHPA